MLIKVQIGGYETIGMVSSRVGNNNNNNHNNNQEMNYTDDDGLQKPVCCGEEFERNPRKSIKS